MQAAKQFIKQLQEGNTTEAIKTIQESLHSRSVEKINEQRVQVLESYGFTISEKMDKEEDDDDMSMDEMKKKMDEMEDEYNSMKDKEDEEGMAEMKKKMDEMGKKYESMKKKDM